MKTAVIKTEASAIEIPLRSFEESHGITMCCVILNEEPYIKDFLLYYKPYFKSIIMIDGGSSDRTVEFATPLVDKIIINKFDGHYSNQVNRVMEKVETDWTMIIDYDERLEKPMLEKLPSLIEQESFDCYAFPRKNFIDGKEVDINYQDRLHRTYCRRVRPVHGEVVGYKNKMIIPAEDGNFLIHSKSSSRHVVRNKAYLFYELKFRHEIGAPGWQTRDNFDKECPTLNANNFTVR